jgi:outer membrane receptor for ferrienterochelin and colicin
MGMRGNFASILSSSRRDRRNIAQPFSAGDRERTSINFLFFIPPRLKTKKKKNNIHRTAYPSTKVLGYYLPSLRDEDFRPVILLIAALILAFLPALVRAQEDKESLLLQGGESVSTPSRRAQPIDESPAPVSVLTGSELRRLGVLTIPEALALLPGVDLIRLSEAGQQISIRGFNGYTSNKVLVMLDSRPLFNLADGSVDWDLIPVTMEDIDRIELVRGPGSALYGENAFFGIINIITRAPTGQRSEARLGGGNGPSYAAHAGFEQPGWRGSVEWVRLDRFWTTRTDVPNPFVEDLGIRPLAAKAAIERAFARAELERDGNRLIVSGGGAQVTADFSDDARVIDRALFVSLDDFFRAGGLDWNANLRASYQDQERQGDPAFPERPYRHFFRIDGELQGVWRPVKDDVLVFGLQASHRAIRDDVFLEPRHSERALTVWSAYVENQLALQDKRVYLTAGARIDGYPGLDPVVSPRVGTIVLLPGAQAVKLGWGRAFRAPTFYDLYGVDAAFAPVIFRGSDRLGVEDISSFTLDYVYHDPRGVRVTASLYYNNLRHLIVFEQRFLNPAGGLFQLENEDRGLAYGGELEVRIKAGDYVELWGNYSYTYAVFVIEGDELAAPFSPRHKGNLGASLDYERFHASLWSTHVSEFVGLTQNAPFQGRIDMSGYSTLSGRIAFDFTDRLSLAASMYDIGGKGHFESPVFAPVMPYYFIELTYRAGD